jgi:hypothetical protein
MDGNPSKIGAWFSGVFFGVAGISLLMVCNVIPVKGGGENKSAGVELVKIDVGPDGKPIVETYPPITDGPTVPKSQWGR